MAERVRVVIATYRRPDRLESALASLADASRSLPSDWSAGVVVVDDDPDGTAAEVARRFDPHFELGVLYRACGSRNISTARNAGLETALPMSDWVASIDDDVVVPADWFSTCADAVTSTDFNAVTGPLTKDFRHGPAWLAEQPFDQLGILAGHDREAAFVCATGNNWVEAEFLRHHPELRFSTELGRSGGEDMDFFYRAVRLGLRPIFVASAAVTEVEPPERCTFRYQLRRAFWLGISEAQISLRLSLASRTRLLARGARRAMTRGSTQLRPQHRTRRGRRYTLAILTQCLGLVLGCVGVRMRHK